MRISRAPTQLDAGRRSRKIIAMFATIIMKRITKTTAPAGRPLVRAR